MDDRYLPADRINKSVFAWIDGNADRKGKRGDSCLGKYGRMVEGLTIAPQRLTAAIETCVPISRPFGLVDAGKLFNRRANDVKMRAVNFRSWRDKHQFRATIPSTSDVPCSARLLIRCAASNFVYCPVRRHTYFALFNRERHGRIHDEQSCGCLFDWKYSQGVMQL
jgi:hypothetical protein